MVVRVTTQRGSLRSCPMLYPSGGAEVWASSNTHREGQEMDERGVPVEVARFDDHLSVIINLETDADRVKVRITKEHRSTEPAQVQIELDPKTLLLRWR